MRTRNQKGYVWRVGDWWWIRFADTRVVNGEAVRLPGVAEKLAPVAPEHRRFKRPPETIREEQERFMERINASRDLPVGGLTLGDFVTEKWYPSIEERHAASTVHHYKFYWKHILSPRCASQILRDVTTPKMQSVLSDIARQNPKMKQATLHRLKSILSAIFKFSIQQGYRPGPNPVRDTYLPRVLEASETVAYDLDTELAMLQFVPEPSRTVLAVAAFAGLRRGEIEGLQWESYDGENLNVTRAMWQGIEGRPKSKKSKAAIPVIAPLKTFLDQHWAASGKPETGIIFKTSKNTPLSMNNLLNDQIRPALDRCVCGGAIADHAGADHEYRRDPKRPEWHGFHAFRRGLATNLHQLGVDDLTIQRILRHSNVAVTQQCYIKTQDAEKIAAMQKLEGIVFDRSRLICNESAKDSEQPGWVQ